MYYIYMLRCRGDTLYTGITCDVRHRMRCHTGALSGGAKYTRAHPPTELAVLWCTGEKTDAARLEYAVKQLTRQQKEQLIAEPAEFLRLLPQLAEVSYIPIPGVTLAQCLKGEIPDVP